MCNEPLITNLGSQPCTIFQERLRLGQLPPLESKLSQQVEGPGDPPGIAGRSRDGQTLFQQGAGTCCMALTQLSLSETDQSKTLQRPITHGSALDQALFIPGNRPQSVSLVPCQATQMSERKGEEVAIPECTGLLQSLLQARLRCRIVAPIQHQDRCA